jgi:hypothetical protein
MICVQLFQFCVGIKHDEHSIGNTREMLKVEYFSNVICSIYDIDLRIWTNTSNVKQAFGLTEAQRIDHLFQ